MTGEWARHTLRILQFEVLYGNMPGVQILILDYDEERKRTKCSSYDKLSTNVTRSYTVSECDKMAQN